MLIAGCGWQGFVYDKQIDGPYRLIAVDVMSQMAVCYSLDGGDAIGRIEETVFAAGWNKDFIVAKRHPGSNKAITEYYFITRSSDSTYADPSVSVTGPLSEEAFNAKKTTLGLPEYSIEISSLK